MRSAWRAATLFAFANVALALLLRLSSKSGKQQLPRRVRAPLAFWAFGWCLCFYTAGSGC
jgi:DMSO/TMAO reductase YedYZ heme-binding membrane subunit